MRLNAVLAVVAFLTAASFAPHAFAQLSEGGGPVSYSAANLEYLDGERQLVLTGDVDVVQGDARLKADRITLYFAQNSAPQQGGGAQAGMGSGDIQRMVAEGEVYYVRPAQSARGDKAVYDIANDSVTFTGNVVVGSDNSNYIRGETLVLQISNHRTTIRPQAGQRVRGVFVPRNGQQGNSGANGRN